MPPTLSADPHLPARGPASHGADAAVQGDERWRERLALLLESTGEGMFGVDRDGRCVFINRAASAMLGYAPQEALQRNIHELIHHSHPDGRHYPQSECPIFAAFREGRPCRIDDEVLWRKDGSSFAVEYSSQPIVEQTANGPSTIGTVATFVDLSRRKEAEVLLRRMNARLERTRDELERLVDERSRQLRGALAQLRELSAHADAVREAERTHIAREIHDELGSLLVALKLDTGWLGRRLAERPELQRKCRAMGELIDRAVDKVGPIVTELRLPLLEQQGLWVALEGLAQEFIDSTRELAVDLRIHIAAGVPPPEGARAIAVFRIFQEMLSNVARHAHAQHLEIRISVDEPPDPVLFLSLRDDGLGATPQALSAPRRYGVLGMRERTARLGGRLSIDTAPGHGTMIRLQLPLARAIA
jgi:PAS domain S-box-containing protein